MLRLKLESSTFHQREPPKSANARTVALAAIATRLFQRCPASAATPGASELSRTAAPTMDTRPMKRKTPTTTSAAPSFGSNSSRRFATTTTGTTAVPAPSDPRTLNVTLLDPALIIQSCPEYSPGSPPTGDATSGGGEAASASNLLAWMVD